MCDFNIRDCASSTLANVSLHHPRASTIHSRGCMFMTFAAVLTLATQVSNSTFVQIACHFDPAAFYDSSTARAGKTRDISVAFLTAIEQDQYMKPESKHHVAEEVST